MKTKLLNIRFLAMTVFFVFAFMLNGQDYNSLETKFYEAIERNDHELAIQYGEQLIKTTNEVVDLFKKTQGTNSTVYAASLSRLSFYHYSLGNLDEAIRLGTEAMEIYKRNNDPYYASSLLTLAQYYSQAGKNDEAIKLGTEAVDIYKRNNDPSYASSLFSLAQYYSNAGKDDEAIKLGTEAVDIYKRSLSNNHPYYASSLLYLAQYYSNAGKNDDAIRLGTEAVEIYKRNNDPSYASSLFSLIQYYMYAGKDDEVIKLGTEAVDIFKNLGNTETTDYVSFLSILASLYDEKGEYSKAERLATEAIEIYKKLGNTETTNYAFFLSILAQQYDKRGENSKAEKLATEAIEIFKKLGNTETTDYALLLIVLAEQYDKRGENSKAEKLANEAIEIFKKLGNTETTDYASLLGILAFHYDNRGEYSEAERLATEAIEIYKKSDSKKNIYYVSSLDILATIYTYKGNYADALRLFTESTNLYKKFYGTGNLEYAKHLRTLAVAYGYIGNYTESVNFATEALEIYKKCSWTETSDYASALKTLARNFADLGNYDEAVRLETQAMDIGKKLNENHVYWSSLNNLAIYYSYMGDFDKALVFMNKVVDNYSKLRGMSNRNLFYYAIYLDNLANIYSSIGNLEEALKVRKDALDIFKRTRPDQPDYAISLSSLANDYFNYGIYDDGINYLMESIKIKKDNILCNFSKLTAQERQRFWDRNGYSFTCTLPSFMLKTGSEEAIRSTYDNAALFSKGLLLTADTEMRKLILESGDEQALRKFEELQATRAWLGKLYEKPIAERQVSTDSLERVAERQEAELVQMSAAYGDFMRNLKLTWKDVQAKLGDKDIAVEFLSFPLMGTDSTMYIALTLKKGYNNPRMIPLFELQQLKEIKTSYYKSPELSDMLWGKLADELDGVQNVYFSPSGELYNIGIESMPDFNGSGSLLNERFNFYRLSSTRELATTKRDAKEASGATIYGGINYNTDVAHMGTPHKEDGQIYAFNRGFEADSAGLRGSQIGSLAGTLEESNKIDSILTAAHVQVDKLTGDNATETSLKNMSGKHKRIMHIATHGFYWSESEAEKTNTQKQLKFLMLDNENNQRYVEDKAMTRSGLLFCGAQNTFNGDAIPEGVDDGVLTAQEISQIDLRGLDLLVLSACQTGLGEISGDGVFGLQRGFKKAGAQTIVMSLWKVNDAATRDLMVQFYTGLADGLTKRQAFLKAQQYLKDHDKTYPYTYKMRNNPHWAAFILLDALQ